MDKLLSLLTDSDGIDKLPKMRIISYLMMLILTYHLYCFFFGYSDPILNLDLMIQFVLTGKILAVIFIFLFLHLCRWCMRIALILLYFKKSKSVDKIREDKSFGLMIDEFFYGFFRSFAVRIRLLKQSSNGFELDNEEYKSINRYLENPVSPAVNLIEIITLLSFSFAAFLCSEFHGYNSFTYIIYAGFILSLWMCWKAIWFFKVLETQIEKFRNLLELHKPQELLEQSELPTSIPLKVPTEDADKYREIDIDSVSLTD